MFSNYCIAVLADGSPENYDKYAPHYDEEVGHVGVQDGVVTTWLKQFPWFQMSSSDKTTKLEIQRVFDAGCGTGLLWAKLRSKISPTLVDSIQVYGGDWSPGMLKVAKEKNIYTDLRIVNLNEKLPYEEGFFDNIISCGVFLENHCGPECLRNIIQTLKKGGLMITAVRKRFYEETKTTWRSTIRECGCELVEEQDFAYAGGANTTKPVLTIRKL